MTEAKGFQLEWKNINYYVPAEEQNNYSFWQQCRTLKEYQILKDVSGHIKTGDLVAILGCSGAGKTTLLAAISQRLRGKLSGDIVLNGVAMSRSQMIRISSFLPQYEINVKTFTAFEHLYFMSHFKMDREATKMQKQEKVYDLLAAVGLRDAANTRIQSLSGGERKRLSLAEELITDPPFLFCDEPTTGLDSYSAYTVVKTLRHLCTQQRVTKTSISSIYGEDSFESSNTPSRDDSGNNSFELDIPEENKSMAIDEDLLESMKNLPNLALFNKHPKTHHKKAIICSIHQPTSDIFELFTHIILMDAGRLVYQGSTEDAFNFFTNLGFTVPTNCNPADFYLKTISDNHTNRSDGTLVKKKYEYDTAGLYNGSWLMRTPSAAHYMDNLNNVNKISWMQQVYLLLIRFMTEDVRNLKQGLITLALFMVTSVTLAIMYSGVKTSSQTSIQDLTGSIFVLSSEMIFSFSYGVMYIFPSALPILRREVGEGIYSLSAYYFAVILSFVPMAFVKSYMFLSIVYGSVYYERGFLVFMTMGLALSLSGIAAVGYGLFLSSFFETERMACECASPFDLLFLIFGGAYYNVDSIPIIKYLSLFFYSNEALMYEFWIDVNSIDCPKKLGHPCLKNGLEVLQRSSYRTANYTFWADCIGLLAVGVVFNMISYCFIRRYIKRSGYY